MRKKLGTWSFNTVEGPFESSPRRSNAHWKYCSGRAGDIENDFSKFIRCLRRAFRQPIASTEFNRIKALGSI
jgi:hypothetical protein